MGVSPVMCLHIYTRSLQVCVYIHVYMYVCTIAYMYTDLHVCVYRFTYMDTEIVCVCVDIYVYRT